MRPYIITLFICLSAIATRAQNEVIYSAPFPEPVDGDTRLAVLENGNIFHYYLSPSSMQVKIYDKDGQTIINKNNTYTTYTQGKSLYRGAGLIDMFETNGDIVVLYSINKGKRNLWRFVLDGTTGALKKADELGEVGEVKGYGYVLEDLQTNYIYTDKDPVSDHYAVLLFDGYNIKSPAGIKVIVYNGQHEEVSSASLQGYEDIKDINYGGMELYDKTVYLLTNRYVPKQKKLMNIPVTLSILRSGTHEFETKELAIQPSSIKSKHNIVYNPGLNTLFIVTTTETKSKIKHNLAGGTTVKYYETMLTQADPASLTIISSKPYTGEKAMMYARNVLKLKDGFNGIAPEVYGNKDKTITLMPESQYEVSTSRSTATYVDKIGLVTIDETGKEKDAVVIPIRTVGRVTPGRAGADYFEYRYVNADNASYIILNDLPENFKKAPGDKLHTMTTISDANTVVYKITDGNISESYLFGKPASKRATRFSMIGNSTFDERTNTYATIVVNGEDKKARVAWVKLD